MASKLTVGSLGSGKGVEYKDLSVETGKSRTTDRNNTSMRTDDEPKFIIRKETHGPAGIKVQAVLQTPKRRNDDDSSQESKPIQQSTMFEDDKAKASIEKQEFITSKTVGKTEEQQNKLGVNVKFDKMTRKRGPVKINGDAGHQ